MKMSTSRGVEHLCLSAIIVLPEFSSTNLCWSQVSLCQNVFETDKIVDNVTRETTGAANPILGRGIQSLFDLIVGDPVNLFNDRVRFPAGGKVGADVSG